TVRLWDVAAASRRPFVARHPGPVVGLALSPDGRLLATASPGLVTVWDVAEGKEWMHAPATTADANCRALDWARGGAVALGTTVFRPFQHPSGRPLDQANALVGAAAFDPAGTVLAVADASDRTVWLCDPATGRPRTPVDRP